MRANYFRCGMCEKVRRVKDGMWCVFDKNTNVLICKTHKPTK